MFAVVVPTPGGPEAMLWQEVDEVVAAPGEVVIDVVAAGVNRADVLQRRGFYPPPVGFTDVLGLECSGVVSELGEGVTSVHVGDEVCALLSGGGYAQRVAVPVGQVMPLPDGLDLVTAASLPEVACTVWSNLMDVADMQRGDWVLIHGGAGGIGSHAIQVARAFKAKVAVTVGSDTKAQWCRDLGADLAINYREKDFVEKVKRATGGRGVDVILDNMGAKYLGRNVEALAGDGRLIVIGLQGGVVGELNLGQLLGKRASIHATSLRNRSAEEKADICSEVVELVWPLIESARVRPIVDTALPITDVAKAHERMESSEHIGKIVLRVAAD
ncbi:MAG: NAD(P)H-quinone oxidoreductase [Actinomycetes bacterium]